MHGDASPAHALFIESGWERRASHNQELVVGKDVTEVKSHMNGPAGLKFSAKRLPQLPTSDMPSADPDEQHAIDSLMAIAVKGAYAPNSTSRHDVNLIICARCFDAAARTIFCLETDSDTYLDFWKKIRRSHREFWIDLAAFITQPRDLTALGNLGARLLLNDATCRLTTHNFPSPSLDTLSSFLSRIIWDFLSCVSLAFGHCFYQSSRGPLFSTIRFSATGAFPTSQADLMPRGANDTMRSILYLWELGFDGSEFVVFAWLSMCWRELCPLLETERIRYLNLLTKRVGEAISRAENHPLVTNTEMEISHLVGLWHFMHHDVPWARRFFDGYHDLLIELIPKVQRLLPKFENNAKRIDAHLAICAHFHGRWKTTPITDPGTTDSDGNPLPRPIIFESTGDPITNFHRIVKNRRKQLGCDYHECHSYGRPGHTSVQRCSRCFFVRYCSRECQRAAWKEGSITHKELCPIYQAVPRPDVDCDAFVEECRTRGTSTDQLAIVLYHMTNMYIRDLPITAHAEFHIQGSSHICACAVRALTAALQTSSALY